MDKAPKGHRVELDEERRICFLKVWGLWSEADGQAYAAHFAAVIEPWLGTRFDVVADISEFPPQREEVSVHIQETMRHAAANGLRRAANVVSSAMTKLQIQRLSEETGLPAFSFFTSVNDAVKWLTA